MPPAPSTNTRITQPSCAASFGPEPKSRWFRRRVVPPHDRDFGEQRVHLVGPMTHEEVAGPQHLGARVVSEIGLQQVLLVPKPAVIEIDAGVWLRQADIMYVYGNARPQSRQHLAIEELNVAAFPQRVRRIYEQHVVGFQRFEKAEVDFLDAGLHEFG